MDATAWKRAKNPALVLLTWPGLSTLMPRLWPALMALAVLAAGGAAVAQSQTAPRVKFVTSEGEFVVEVYPDKAPKTVANFLQYVNDKHYDGTVFHRVISNFMVQGGGFDARYQQKPTRAPVLHEGREALAKGGDKNTVGTLAMARTNDPQSATAQFFINVKDNDFLNPTPIPPGDPVPRFEYQGRVYEKHTARPTAERGAIVRLHRLWQSRQRHGGGQQNQVGAHRRGWPLPQRRAQDARSYNQRFT